VNIVKRLVLLWLVSVAGALLAQDEKLPSLKVGAETYTNVTVTSVTATDIYFSHSRGLGSAKLRNLEPAMQQHFHFDPAKAAATQSAQAQANTLYIKAAKEAVTTRPRAPSPTTEQPGSDDGIPPHPLYAKSFLNQPTPVLVAEKWLTAPPDIQGKFVLINFWATTSEACRASIPHLNGLCAEFKDRLVVIGLSNEPEEAVRKMTEPRIDYAVAIDTLARSFQAVEVSGIPHALLVDPKGVVRFEGMPQYLEARSLEKLMARFGQ